METTFWLSLVAVLGNVILGLIVYIFRQSINNFEEKCELRHFPIDNTISEIKKRVDDIWEAIDELRQK